MFRALPRSSPASGGKLLFCSLYFHLPPLTTWSNISTTCSTFAHTRLETEEHGDKKVKKPHRWPNTPLVFFRSFTYSPNYPHSKKMGASSPVVSTAQTNTGLWHEDKFCPELTRAIVTGVSESTVNICSTCHWQEAQILWPEPEHISKPLSQAGTALGANEISTLRDVPGHSLVGGTSWVIRAAKSHCWHVKCHD